MTEASLTTRFSIGLVNYKTPDLTRHCLSLLHQHFESGALSPERVEVWVVDNDSQDESTQYLRSLPWIHLIERKPEGPEKGFQAHGRGLDLILEQIHTDFLFLLHTDTLIYDASVFDTMLTYCLKDPDVAVVGCLDQIDRGHFRRIWRVFTRFLKHHIRKIKMRLHLKTRPPKPYTERYIKSFCALWNVKLIKQFGYHFLMDDNIPGYSMQDKLSADGYKIKKLSPSWLFRYLDHVEAGTVGLVSGYDQLNRRTRRKNSILTKLNQLDKTS